MYVKISGINEGNLRKFMAHLWEAMPTEAKVKSGKDDCARELPRDEFFKMIDGDVPSIRNPKEEGEPMMDLPRCSRPSRKKKARKA